MTDYFPLPTLLAQALAAIEPRMWLASDSQPLLDNTTSTAHLKEPDMFDTNTAPQSPEYNAWLEFMALDGSTPPPSPVMFSSDGRREQAELVRIIGDRLRAARELCNLSQNVAAQRLGYSNSSKLSKIEGATDTNSVPLWLIGRAAKVYEVSIDYLFGMTDDWEVGARGIQPWLLDAIEKMRVRDLSALDRLHCEIATVSKHTADLITGIAEVTQAIDTLRTRAPIFDELPASGTLVGRAERLQERAIAAETALRKLRLG